MIVKPVVRVSIALIVGLLIPGCGLGSPTEADSYREPGWMAERRQTIEENQQTMTQCLEESGAKEYIATASDGSVGLGYKNDRFSQEEWEAIVEQFSPILEVCEGKISSGVYQPSTVDYEMMIDTRSCLINEGYSIPQPPTQEVWLESFGSVGASEPPFIPYQFVFEAKSEHLTSQDFAELNQICPQGPWGAFGTVEAW